MKKNLFSSLLAVLILFWAVGMTSYSQEKTETKAKTEKMEKKIPTKIGVKKENVSKVGTVTKSKMTHKHHMKSEKMKGKKKTDSMQKEKSN